MKENIFIIEGRTGRGKESACPLVLKVETKKVVLNSTKTYPFKIDLPP